MPSAERSAKPGTGSTSELLLERRRLQARLRLNRYQLHEHRIRQRFDPEPLKLVGFSFAAGFICHELGFSPGRIIRGFWYM